MSCGEKYNKKDRPTDIWVSQNQNEYREKYPFLSVFIKDILPETVKLHYFKKNRNQK